CKNRLITRQTPIFFASEQILQAKLDNTRRKGLADLTPCGEIDTPSRQVEVRMIGEIEHFGAELQPLPLTHGKEFLQGEVRLLQRWSNNGVASGITERCQATTRH